MNEEWSLESQLTWIPVTERLPDVGEEGRKVAVKMANGDEGIIFGAYVKSLLGCELWLPLPPLPQED